MDDVKKKRIIGVIIIITGLILLVAIIYFLFFYNFSPPVPVEEEAPEAAEGQKPPNLPLSPKAVINVSERIPPSSEEITKEELKRLAASFAERFGSFSNQSPYTNILDLKIFMTPKMQTWADKYIEDINAKKSDSSIYYGITTKAVATETKKYDKDLNEAEFLVKTQRLKALSSTKNTATSYEDILIKLDKNGGVWKVDGAYWQTK